MAKDNVSNLSHITDLLAEERIAEIPTPKFGNLRCRYYGIAGA